MVNIPFSIQVYILNGYPTDTINARELYDFLEPATDFLEWLNSHIDMYQLEEHRDYSIQDRVESHSSNSPTDELQKRYFISLDAVKIIAAVDLSVKGKQLRYDLQNFAHAENSDDTKNDLVALPAVDMMNLLRLLRHYQGLAVELPQAPMRVNELLDRMTSVRT